MKLAITITLAAAVAAACGAPPEPDPWGKPYTHGSEWQLNCCACLVEAECLDEPDRCVDDIRSGAFPASEWCVLNWCAAACRSDGGR